MYTHAHTRTHRRGAPIPCSSLAAAAAPVPPAPSSPLQRTAPLAPPGLTPHRRPLVNTRFGSRAGCLRGGQGARPRRRPARHVRERDPLRHQGHRHPYHPLPQRRPLAHRRRVRALSRRTPRLPLTPVPCDAPHGRALRCRLEASGGDRRGGTCWAGARPARWSRSRALSGCPVALRGPLNKQSTALSCPTVPVLGVGSIRRHVHARPSTCSQRCRPTRKVRELAHFPPCPAQQLRRLSAAPAPAVRLGPRRSGRQSCRSHRWQPSSRPAGQRR